MPRINSLNTFVLSTIINASSGSGDETLNYQGATMVFVLSGTAPTGWVKETSDNDYTLRCVTGSALSGGTVNFSTVMSPKTITGSVPITGNVGPTTLTSTQIANHTHPVPAPGGLFFVGGVTVRNQGPAAPNTSKNLAPTTMFQPQGSPNLFPTPPSVTSHEHPNGPGISPPVTLGTVNLTVKYVEAILATRT